MIRIPDMRLNSETDGEDIDFVLLWCRTILTHPHGRNVCGCNLKIMNTIFIRETGKEPSSKVSRWWREIEDLNRTVYADRGGCLMATEIAHLAVVFIGKGDTDMKQIEINLWRPGEKGNQ